MPFFAQVHVNFRPLNGTWDGQSWDQQTARCSNNFLSGPNPPIPPDGVNNLVWRVFGLDNSGSVVFNVSVDLPGGPDEAIFTGLTNGVQTSYLPELVQTQVHNGVPHHNSVPVYACYQKGIYISSVHGASSDFMLEVRDAAYMGAGTWTGVKWTPGVGPVG